MDGDLLLLCSSNYTKEYLIDVLEALGRPSGSLMHVRYRKKYIDGELWNKLPIRDINHENILLNYRILHVFVYQEIEANSGIQWKRAYPTRFGKIKDCYKTGDGQDDVAYFYFEVEEYCKVDDLDNLNQEFLKIMYDKNVKSERCFAAARSLQTIDILRKPTTTAFQSTVGRFDISHFRSPDGNIRYSPVFLLIQGIKNQTLKYDKDLHQSYYELTENKKYMLELNVFLRESPIGVSHSIRLDCDEHQFTYPNSIEEPIYSSYDEFMWRLVPSKVQKNVSAVINVSSDGEPPSIPNYQVLDLKIPIYVEIKFNRLVRIIEIIQDLGLATATVLIAAVGLLQKTNPLPTYNNTKDINWMLLAAALLFLVGIVFKGVIQFIGK